MKIGIETIYDGYNFGCFLQAFAMQTYLEGKGHNVFVLDHTTLKSRLIRRYFAKSIKRTILKMKRFRTFSKSWDYLNVVPFSSSPQLDFTIIGSDEVWNIEHPAFEHLPQYYGLNGKSNKIMTYGPSLGYSTLDSYKKYPELVKGIIENINLYCVRDHFTEDFLHNIGVSDVKIVCDPTFLIYDKWDSLRQKCSIDKDYLLYYSYWDETPFKESIIKFAHENNLKLVVAGFNYGWCDEQKIVNPFEFLDLVKNAKYIVTSTFHGTIFSVLFKKNFILIHPQIKAKELLETFQLKDKLVEKDYNQFSYELKRNIDYSKVFDIILTNTDKSKGIIEECLNSNN